MSFQPKLAACAAAVALLAIAGSAHAVVTATATISTVTFTLIDLDLTDGITPSITFTNPNSLSSVSLIDHFPIFEFRPGTNQPTTASANNVYGSAAASTSATGGQSSISLKGSNLVGTSVSEFAQASPFDANFSLSPKTLISFTATFSVAASTTVGYLNGNVESGQSQVYMTTSFIHNGVYDYNRASRSVSGTNTYNNATQTYSGTTASASGTVELLVANRSSTTVTGHFNASTDVSGQSQLATPVPENNTLSLMGLGLVGLAVGVRRLRSSHGRSA